MAYMNQEKKAKIAAALKGIVPKDWKYSLRVHHHSSIIMTISEGPKELTMVPASRSYGQDTPASVEPYRQLNVYHIDKEFAEGSPVAETVQKIVEALNIDNHDRSDIMTDYFDVGHYVSLNVGSWQKPFKSIN